MTAPQSPDDTGRVERLEQELQRLQQELTRAQTEADRLRGELAAQSGGRMDKPELLEGSLFISEMEVRKAIARQLQNAAKLLQATKVVYLLFDGKDELLAQRPALGLEESDLPAFRVPVHRGVSGEVFRTRKTIKLDDIAADTRSTEEPLARLKAENGICVPLMVHLRDEENRVIDTRVIGVLWVLNRRSGVFSADDARVLTMFARQVAAVVSNAQIFNELMRRNEALVHTLENLPAGILFIGADDRIQLINTTARRLFAVPPEQGPGDAYFRIIPHQETTEILGKALRGDEDVVARVPFEVDEEDRVFQIQVARVRHEEDALNGVVAIFDDVTELEQIDRMKTEFVQTFSTELLGPLASIRGFASMLRSVPPDEFGGDMRHEIHDIVTLECDRLRRHIQDLLNVSRFEHGLKVHLNTHRLSLGELVKRVVDREAALCRQHTFNLSIPDDLPEVVADEQRLEEVTYNLVNNAIIYSPDGGEIQIRLRTAGDNLRFEVQDNGLGIPPEHHEQVWQKFTRFASGNERVRTGRGIGLFISRFFIEAHGGNVGLQSEVGQGSTFWYEIPREPRVQNGQVEMRRPD